MILEYILDPAMQQLEAQLIHLVESLNRQLKLSCQSSQEKEQIEQSLQPLQMHRRKLLAHFTDFMHVAIYIPNVMCSGPVTLLLSVLELATIVTEYVIASVRSVISVLVSLPST